MRHCWKVINGKGCGRYGHKKSLNIGSQRQEKCRHIIINILSVVTEKNAVFWDGTPYGSCKNRRFEELSASIIRVTRISELGTALAITSNRCTLVMANVPSSPILVTVMMEA
jgi:hypothetical protein